LKENQIDISQKLYSLIEECKSGIPHTFTTFNQEIYKVDTKVIVLDLKQPIVMMNRPPSTKTELTVTETRVSRNLYSDVAYKASLPSAFASRNGSNARKSLKPGTISRGSSISSQGRGLKDI
jgi:hypothetical protein